MHAVYSLTLSFSIDDDSALWTAAAAAALAAPGTTMMDVIETIGPQADPDIADCIAMLIGVGTFPGCIIDDFSCTPSPRREHGHIPTMMAANAAHPATVPRCAGMQQMGTARLG